MCLSGKLGRGVSLHLSPGPVTANWPGDRFVSRSVAVGGGPLECAAAGRQLSDKNRKKKSLGEVFTAAVDSDSEGGVHLASIWWYLSRVGACNPTLHHPPQPNRKWETGRPETKVPRKSTGKKQNLGRQEPQSHVVSSILPLVVRGLPFSFAFEVPSWATTLTKLR